MTLLEVVILGVVQGASEFLPISSSGHLVIFQSILGIQLDDIFLEVVLHFGTLLAVVVYFWRDLVALITAMILYLNKSERSKHKEKFDFCIYIIIGTVPVGIGGLLFKDYVESAFESTALTGVMLLVTALLLWFTKLVPLGDKQINRSRALTIGIAQLIAILPGISRSGSTIATAMFLGVNRQQAARFSFILSVPAVTAAFFLKLVDAFHARITTAELLHYGIGALVAFIIGLAAIHFLLKLIATNRFYLFGFWCLIAGLFTLFYL